MKPSLRNPVLALHRWISLALAAFWLLQAATGTFLVFHWEIDDVLVAGADRPADLAAIDDAANRLAPAGSGREVSSIWTTANGSSRFDISIGSKEPAIGETVRVNGAGEILRVRKDDERWTNGGWISTLTSLHHNLLAGETGSWIVGLSGIFLASNLILGLVLGWPAQMPWRRVLRPISHGPPAARRYSWHRAMGLWAGIPALVLVVAGVLLVFSEGVEKIIEPEEWSIEIPPLPGIVRPIPMPLAVQHANALYPAARVSGIYYPSDERGAYVVRLRQPAEDALTYGKTTVFVDAANGRVLAHFDALAAAPARRYANGLFAFHIGEVGGLAGRVAVALLGLWLIVEILLGFLLWTARRRIRRD